MKQMMLDVSRVIRVKVRDLPEPVMEGPNRGVWQTHISRLVATRDPETGKLVFSNEYDPITDDRAHLYGIDDSEPTSMVESPASFRNMLLSAMVGKKTLCEVLLYAWRKILAELKREGRERSPVISRFCGKKKCRACTSGLFRMVSQVTGLKLAWVRNQRVGYTFSGGVYDRETDSCCGHLDVQINKVDVLRYDFWDMKGVVEEKFVPYRYNVEKLREECDRWVAERKEEDRAREMALVDALTENQVKWMKEHAGDPPSSLSFKEHMAQMMRGQFPEFYDPKIEIQPMSPIAEVVVDTAREAMAQMVGVVLAPGWEAKVEAAIRRAIGETQGRVKITVREGPEEGSATADFEFECQEDVDHVDRRFTSGAVNCALDELKGGA